MRSEFEEIAKELDLDCEWIELDDTHPTKKGVYKDFTTDTAWNFWQDRQTEVDELKLINFDSELHLDAAKDEIKRLQKRLDAVNLVLDGLKNANYMHSENKAYNALLIEKLEQALKGGGE